MCFNSMRKIGQASCFGSGGCGARNWKHFCEQPPALIGMEACGSAHHWARVITAMGHEVRLMHAKYVKAYVKRGKSDLRDAEAICEAGSTTVDDAVCADQERRAADRPLAGTRPRPAGEAAHAADECHPRPVGRAWHCRPRRAARLHDAGRQDHGWRCRHSAAVADRTEAAGRAMARLAREHRRTRARLVARAGSDERMRR